MDIFDQAVCFAVEKHSGQRRKLSSAPYVLHPLEVAAIVGTMTDDKETLAACVLHDTIEDTDTTFEEIVEHFGRRVALLVMTETEDKRPDKPPAATWELRKEETLLMLQNTSDIAVKMLWLGDKLSNMRSYARQYRVEGNALWNTFHQKDPRRQLWYYERITECLFELREFPVYQEYVELTNFVFQDFIGRNE